MTAAPAAVAPLIIAVAPNGARRGKADHPALPVTTEEIARAAAECREAGAAMLHLHVRDRDGRHLLDADAYRAATAAVRAEVGDGLVVQITSEAAGIYGPAQQMAVVRETRPEAVSVALREIAPGPEDEAAAADFLAWLDGERVMVQLIVYSPEDIGRLHDLRRRGVVPDGPHFLLFVLGRYSTGQQSAPGDLLPFLGAHDPRDLWSVCAFGRRESACTLAAAALGGHARVGFENNLQRSDGTLAGSNAELVGQLCAGAALMGRPLADAGAAREILCAPVGALETRARASGG